MWRDWKTSHAASGNIKWCSCVAKQPLPSEPALLRGAARENHVYSHAQMLTETRSTEIVGLSKGGNRMLLNDEWADEIRCHHTMRILFGNSWKQSAEAFYKRNIS